MDDISYKCEYIKDGENKFFTYDAKSDEEALDLAIEEMERFNIQQYKVYRITEKFIYRAKENV
jgi:hypothetical protein